MLEINKKYIDAIALIREKRLITWKKIAQEMGVSYVGLVRMKKGDYPHRLIRVAAKMKAFINKNREYLDGTK
jgi:hypothetical protein